MYLLFVMIIGALYAVHEKVQSDFQHSIFAGKHPEWFFDANKYPDALKLFGIKVTLKLFSAILMAIVIVLSLAMSEVSWMRLPVPVIIEAIIYFVAYVSTYFYFFTKLLTKSVHL